MEEFTLIKKPPKKEIKKMILEAGFIDCSDRYGTYFTLPCLEKYNKLYLIYCKKVRNGIKRKEIEMIIGKETI